MEGSGEDMQKIPALEKAMLEMTKNVERLPLRLEDQRQATDENQRAIATLLSEFSASSRGRSKRREVPEKGKGPPAKRRMMEGTEGSSSHQSKVEQMHGIGDRHRFKKLDMPVFSGEDPDSWVFRAERYFDICGLSDEDKKTVVAINFEGEAIDWYQWTIGRDPIDDWLDLKRRLLGRFRPSQEGSLCARLLAVRQEGTVADFRRRFARLAAPLPHLSEEVLESTFLTGLDPAVRAEVVCFEPLGLEQIMKTAQLVEDQADAAGRNRPDYRTIPKPKSSYPYPHKSHPRGTKTSPSFTLPTPQPSKSMAFKRLTDAELQERREKGLCFRCEEKFTVGHRCKTKELRTLGVQVEGVEEMEEEVPPEDVGKEEEEEVVELFLNTVVGFNAPGTIKVRGKIAVESVTVLLDCGATHNFISQNLVEQMGLAVDETTNYGVILGSGKAVRGKRICRGCVCEPGGDGGS